MVGNEAVSFKTKFTVTAMFSISQCTVVYYAMHLEAMDMKEISCFVLLLQVMILYTACMKKVKTEVTHVELALHFM